MTNSPTEPKHRERGLDEDAHADSMDRGTKMPLTSMDIAAEKREQLRKLFPEVFTEGKVDFDQLKRTLGEWVEPSKERFGLNWPGKTECMRIIQQPSVATLKPVRDESVNFDHTENLFIEGENLEVLKLLQKSYFGKVKMVYIDPPYNTGNDFIYPDKYSETLNTYLIYTGQLDGNGNKLSTNTDVTGRYHSNWLNMMYPRLYLARNLLREDGMIFISIDDNEQANLKGLCDQIFGEENFITNYIWKARSGKDHTAKHVSANHEMIICYAKNLEFIELAKDIRITRGGIYSDERGTYSREQLRQWGTNDRRIDRPTMFYSVTAPDNSEILPIKENGEEGCWRVSKSRMNKLIEKAEADFVYNEDKQCWSIYAKKYSGEETKTAYNSILDTFGTSATGTRDIKELFLEKIFDTAKPSSLIKHLVHISNSKSDAIVLDFFAGSSTTAQAVMQLNTEDGGDRQFICVQLPEPIGEKSEAHKAGFKTIANIAKERIRRAGKKIANEQNINGTIDTGFKALKLDRSNFKVWESNIEKIGNLEQQLFDHVDHINIDHTPEDILYEILLKAGFSLTTPIEKRILAGKVVFAIEEGALLICLEKQLTQEVINAIAAEDPQQVICLDEGFKDNDLLKVNAMEIFRSHADGKETEIAFETI